MGDIANAALGTLTNTFLMQEASQATAWYNGGLVVAAFVAIATFGRIQYTERQRRENAWQDELHRRAIDQRDRKAALLAAFSGELHHIRHYQVRTYLRNALARLERGQLPIVQAVTEAPLPRYMYEANADSLGELRDPEAARDISTLYSMMERAGIELEYLDKWHEVQRELSESAESVDDQQNTVRKTRRQHFGTLASIMLQVVPVDTLLKQLIDNPETSYKTLKDRYKVRGEEKKDVELAYRVLERLGFKVPVVPFPVEETNA